MFQSIHQSTQSSDNSEDDIKAKKESILDPNAMMHGLNRSMQMGGPQDPANSGGSNTAQAMFHEEDEKPGQMKTIQKAGVEEEEPVQGKSIQKAVDEEEVQMKESSADSTQSAARGSSTQSTLPRDVNARMEASFNTNFSNVNIHTNDSTAAQMKALAYTQGNNVHFAPGQYNPNTSKGQELIGHEYTHVVQQGSGNVAPTRQAKGMSINDNPALEHEADVMGKKAAEGKGAVVNGVGSGVQRKASINEKDSKIKNTIKHLHNIGDLLNKHPNIIDTPKNDEMKNDNDKSDILRENAKTARKAPFPKAIDKHEKKWGKVGVKYSNRKYTDGSHSITLSPKSGSEFKGLTKQTPSQFIDDIMNAVRNGTVNLDCSLYTSVVLVSSLKDYLFNEEESNDSFDKIFKKAIRKNKLGDTYYDVEKIMIGGGFSGQGTVDGNNYHYLDHPWTMDPAKVSKHLEDAPLGTIISINAVSTSYLNPRTDDPNDGFVARNQNLIKVDKNQYATNFGGSTFFTIEEIFSRLIKGTISPERARYYLRSEIRYDFDKYKSKSEK